MERENAWCLRAVFKSNCGLFGRSKLNLSSSDVCKLEERFFFGVWKER
jgi:hypothetical protein